MPLKLDVFLLLVLTFLSQNVFSQTFWQENFSDSNFTANPTWVGDTANFSVNPGKALQLNAPAVAATSALATASTAGILGTWQFTVRLAFNPSSSNYAKVFLVSSTPNFSNPLQGYYVRIGGSTDDRLSLYRQSGITTVLVAQSAAGLVDKNLVNLRINVQRDSNHVWTLAVDTLAGNNFAVLSTGIDSTHLTSQFFGWQCVYTSTRSKAFYLDDISVNGQAFTDVIKPRILGASFPDEFRLRLQFSEPVDSASAVKAGSYILTQTNTNPQSVVWQNTSPDAVVLAFASAFQSATSFSLRCDGVEDRFGNELKDTTLTLNYFRPFYRNVIFSEIMADPTPTVGLPDAEFVELYNATAYTINLDNYTYSAGNDAFTLPAYVLQDNERVLLVSQDVAQHFSVLPHIVIPASSSYLSNSGEQLILRDENGLVLDALTYSADWHTNPAKRDGGWSLENVDMISQCVDYTTWSSSNWPTGGTPGTYNLPEVGWYNRNSQISEVRWQSPTELLFVFNQGLSRINPPVFESTIPVIETIFDELKPYEIRVRFGQPIGNQPVTLRLLAGQSCEGQYIADTLTFATPTPVQAGDVVINEVLFNPSGEVQDFVELWNISQKTILLSDLFLANVDENHNPTNQFATGSANTLILPGQFLVVTADVSALCNNYNCKKLRFYSEMATPSLPDGGAHIGLITPNLEVLESVNFSEDWHHPLITNPEMVSLERINPYLRAAQKSSWHSASTQSGYATPGRLNSQFNSTEAAQERFWLSTETLSPNNDGQNDIAIISYDLPEGSMLTMEVFSLQGILQTTLANNVLTQPGGTVIWDGSTQNVNLAASGIYLIFATWFTPDGQTGNAKLNIAVSR